MLNSIQAIIIAVSGTLVATLLVYIFKIRQLYISTPLLYNSSALAEQGIIIELVAYNSSWHMEEDVKVCLPDRCTYSLLAADDNSITINNNVILIPRLGKFRSAKALLLVEGEHGDAEFVPQINSKAAIGKYIKKSSGFPPNYGMLLVFFLVIVLVAFCLYYFIKRDDEKHKENLAKIQSGELYADKYRYASSMGWKHLNMYDSSNIAKSYKETEFPAYCASLDFSAGVVSMEFIITNKTTEPFEATGYITSSSEDISTESLGDGIYHGLNILPMQSGRLALKARFSNLEEAKTCKASLTLKVGKKEQVHLIYQPPSVGQLGRKKL